MPPVTLSLWTNRQFRQLLTVWLISDKFYL